MCISKKEGIPSFEKVDVNRWHGRSWFIHRLFVFLLENINCRE